VVFQPRGDIPDVLFRRHSLTDGSGTLLTTGFIGNDTTARKLGVLPIAGGSSLVSNAGFSYSLGICPGEGGTFWGARIAYTYISAGD